MNKIFTVFGKKGSGKSYTTSKIIDYYYKNNIRDNIVTIDFSDDYIKDKNLNFLSSVYIDSETALKIDYQKIIEDNNYILFEFGGMPEKTRKKAAANIVNAVFNLKNTLLVVDEAYLFLPKTGSIEEFETAISGGRKEGIDQVYITQRIQQINLLAISQSDIFICFKVQESREIKKIMENTSIDSAEKLKNLKKREMIVQYEGKTEIRENNIII